MFNMLSKHFTIIDGILVVVFGIFTFFAAFCAFFLWREVVHQFFNNNVLAFSSGFFAIFATLIAIILGSFMVALILIDGPKDSLVDRILDVFVVAFLLLFTFIPCVFSLILVRDIARGVGMHRPFYLILSLACAIVFGFPLYQKLFKR